MGAYVALQPEWIQDAVMYRPVEGMRPLLDQVPPHVDSRFREVLNWMKDHGWMNLLKHVTGVEFDVEGQLDDFIRPIEIKAEWREKQGFDDFGGGQFVTPGDPALSLLYHALASPHVRLLPEYDQPANYATLDQLDAIENYIYALSKFTPENLTIDAIEETEYVLAVMAYEYRTAKHTPHRQHADLVFARTGMARIGQEPPNYDRRMRGFTNAPSDEEMSRYFATTPARYGLFLAKPVSLKELNVRTTEDYLAGDKQRTFLLPVRKLFAGDPLLQGGSFRFVEHHRNEKLRGLFTYLKHENEGYSTNFDIDRVPFLRTSQTADDGRLVGHDSDLVELTRAGSSALLSSTPGPLVTEAHQDGRRIWFEVPPHWQKGNRTNRRYHTFKLMRDKSRDPEGAIIGHIWEQIFPSAQVTDLREPRNAPMFANIRYRMRDDLVGWDHLGPTDQDFPNTLDGSFKAAAFEDAICHGCVSAEFVFDNSARIVEENIRSLHLTPAVSLVTAPDLFPWTDIQDIGLDFPGETKDFFVEGGTEDLSGIRMRGDTGITIPGEPLRAAFPIESKNYAESSAWDTLAAVVSQRREQSTTSHGRPQHAQSFLPDVASNVFYPGWDATYGGKYPNLFLTTTGLGSPFAEDMKLCAAANGMWPVGSPDAARTFQGALEKIPVIGAPSTSIPLLDHEIGYHPNSPAILEHGLTPRTGWDGEHGPFIGTHDEMFTVDFADIVATDYVRNVLEDKLDGSVLRSIPTEELIARMHALRNAVKAVCGRKVKKSKLWLIGAEKVDDWLHGDEADRGRMFPKQWALRADLILRATKLALGSNEYIFLFVDQPEANDPKHRAGSRLKVDRECIYVVHANDGDAAWVKLLPGDVHKPLSRPWN